MKLENSQTEGMNEHFAQLTGRLERMKAIIDLYMAEMIK
jgi:hypothetical protein